MNKKIYYFDYLRILAMLSVVLTHVFVTARTDFLDKNFWDTYSTEFFSQVLHYCVPIFLMITGALFLNPKKEISISVLFKKYILKYILSITFFGWIFSIMELLFKEGFIFQPMLIFRSFFNMLQGKSWEHMWYLYMLVGLLLLIPLLKTFINNCKSKDLDYLIILLFIFTSLIPTLYSVTGFKLGIAFPISSVYILYLLLGYKLHNMTFEKKYIINITTVACIIFFLITNYIYSVYSNEWISYFGYYNSPVIVLFSSSIFMLFKNKFNVSCKKAKLISILCSTSYGVYIYHMLWINLIYKFFGISPYGSQMPIKVIMIFGIVTILSVFTTWISQKIPLLKKII